MKKVIVTGANGFVGTAVCRELAKDGIEIIAIVRDKSSLVNGIEKLPKIRIIYSDISDFGNLHLLIDDRDVDALIHLAWIGSSGILRSDYDVQIKNILYACDTVKACANMNCKRFVFASSIMEYEIASIMATEVTPSKSSLYSSAKIAADYMVRTMAGAYGIDYIRAVVSNIYGPGELSPRLINTSLRKLLNGEHCSFSSGEQMYDFIYISDAARAFVEISRKGISNRTYYIGSTSPRPLREYLCEMRDVVDPSIVIGLGELSFDGVSLSYNEFDINAVKKDTGFVPSVSFAEGIRRTMEWINGKK